MNNEQNAGDLPVFCLSLTFRWLILATKPLSLATVDKSVNMWVKDRSSIPLVSVFHCVLCVSSFRDRFGRTLFVALNVVIVIHETICILINICFT